MVAQARQLALPSHCQRVSLQAALLAFCSPYPVQFAIEEKSYALLVLLVALWWWLRCRFMLHDSARCCLRSSGHWQLGNSANGDPTGPRLLQEGCSELWGHADQQRPAGLGINEKL